MSQVVSIGTYLPPWTLRDRRVTGPDEDALTMAVAAGRAADPEAAAQRVVLVSRDFPLLEGGNGAVLLAALSLQADTPVAEVLGGATGGYGHGQRVLVGSLDPPVAHSPGRQIGADRKDPSHISPLLWMSARYIAQLTSYIVIAFDRTA